ncbi:peroxiredoxin [Methylophilaceae bacterium Uisw_097]
MLKVFLALAVVLALVFIFKKTAFGSEDKLLGKAAPDFKLKNSYGEFVSLKEFKGEWLLVFFYPKDDTPGCTKEACSLRDNFSEIKKLNANVVGISIDSSNSHKEFKEKYNLPFMLLSDPEGETSKKYGALNNFFIFKLAKRQSFMIDPNGIIRRVYRDVSPTNHAQEIKNDLEAFERNS